MVTRLRARAGRLRRVVRDAAGRLDPSRLGLRTAPPHEGLAVVCVYRGRNAPVVRELLAQVPQAVVRLWSLDGEVPEDLRELTVGTGPGNRLALLDRLAAGVPPEAREHALVLADDDVRLVIGDLAQLVEAGRRFGLDLFQPAHLATSCSSWPFTVRRGLVFAREVDYVEQGPLVVLSGAAQRALLPLPDDLDMGWGIEARWWVAAGREGLRLGIVDAVSMLHLGAVGAAYDRSAQEDVLQREVEAAGLQDITELHREYQRTWAWAAWRNRRRGRLP